MGFFQKSGLTLWIEQMRLSDRGLPVFYQRKLTGILGTLIFHLMIVFIIFSVQLNTHESYPAKEIMIEFPDQLKLDEIEKLQEMKKDDQSMDELSDRFLRKNIAVNQEEIQKQTQEEISTEKYIKDLQDQMELPGFKAMQEPKKAEPDKKIPENPEENLNLAPDEKKKTEKEIKPYSGPTNISYLLKDRKARFIPVPVYTCQGRGTVVTEIIVNQKGEVVAASAKKSESTAVDECLYETAEIYARRTLFNADLKAPAQQQGTITYQFIAQ